MVSRNIYRFGIVYRFYYSKSNNRTTQKLTKCDKLLYGQASDDKQIKQSEK